MKNLRKIYTCPMHEEVQQNRPGTCPKCGMRLVPIEKKTDHENMDYSKHVKHEMKPVSNMSSWEKFKMSMTMAMGMEHTGLAGREMANGDWDFSLIRQAL